MFTLVFVLMVLGIVWVALTAFGIVDGGWPFGEPGPYDGGPDSPFDLDSPFDPGDLDDSGRRAGARPDDRTRPRGR